MTDLDKYDMVLVKWEDSRTPQSRWQWVDELDAPLVVSCMTLGTLIGKTEEAVQIAQTLGDLNGSRLQCNGVIEIPRRAIKTIQYVYGSEIYKEKANGN